MKALDSMLAENPFALGCVTVERLARIAFADLSACTGDDALCPCEWHQRRREPQAATAMSCQATTTARTGASDAGKWRRCERDAGHAGPHETTYQGRPYRWSDGAAREPNGGTRDGEQD